MTGRIGRVGSNNLEFIGGRCKLVNQRNASHNVQWSELVPGVGRQLELEDSPLAGSFPRLKGSLVASWAKECFLQRGLSTILDSVGL